MSCLGRVSWHVPEKWDMASGVKDQGDLQRWCGTTNRCLAVQNCTDQNLQLIAKVLGGVSLPTAFNMLDYLDYPGAQPGRVERLGRGSLTRLVEDWCVCANKFSSLTKTNTTVFI